MEDDLNFMINGRRPQFAGKWKTTSICLQLESNLQFWQVEDNNNYFLFKWKTTTVKGKASLVSPGFSWAWHSSAPACSLIFLLMHYSSQKLDMSLLIWKKCKPANHIFCKCLANTNNPVRLQKISNKNKICSIKFVAM